MVDAFLNPTQQLLSHGWKETTQAVQTDLQTVHAMYSGLLQYEKNITEQAIGTCKQLKAQANAAQDAKAKVEAELMRVKSENEQLKAQGNAAWDAKARAEAERNDAWAELARVKSDNEQLKAQVIAVTHKARVKVDALKQQRQELLLERGRLREGRNLSLTLMLKLQHENAALTEQLRGVSTSAAGEEPSASPFPTDRTDERPLSLDLSSGKKILSTSVID